jgi:glycosyltransferase involved in cell wall biosynthesis
MNRYVDMLKDDYDLVVVAPRVFRRSPRYEDADGCRIYRFPAFLAERLLVEYEKVPYFRLSLYMISAVITTLKVIRRERCDIVNSHFVLPTGLVGLIAARLLRRSTLLTVYGTDLTLYRIAYFRPLIRAILDGAGKSFAISEYARDTALEFKPRREIPVVFLCGVDPDKFRPGLDGSAVRRKASAGPDDFLVLTVANLTQRRKRVDVLIRAISRLQDERLKLLIVGQGPLRAELDELADELGISSRMKTIDFVEESGLPQVYAAADLFVLASEEEGLGVPLIEAMSSSRPVIASRTSGLLSLIKDGQNGVFFETNNDEDLARKIAMVRDDADLRTRLAHAARDAAQDLFSQDRQRRKITALVEDLLKPDGETGTDPHTPKQGQTLGARGETRRGQTLKNHDNPK